MGIKVKLLDVSANARELLFAAGRQCYAEGWVGDSWQEDANGLVSIVDNKDGHAYTSKEMVGLIRHLCSSGHTSVLEHIKFTFAIDGVSRSETHQQVRHRLASYCISEDAKIYTSSQRTHKKTIAELYKLKKQYQNMIKFRCINEDTKELSYDKCLDIVYSGEKDVYEVITEHGYKIKTTKEHRYFTDSGWRQLSEIKEGDFVYVNGIEAYKDKNWLQNQYHTNNLSQEEIGALCGVSKHTVRKWVRQFELQKDPGSWSVGKVPPNKGKTKHNYKPLSKVSKKMLGNLNGRYAFKERHHSWKDNQNDYTVSGGYSRVHRYIKRKNICNLCGFKGYTELHHEDMNPKNHDDSNIVELCKACHKAVHKHETKSIAFLSKVTSIKYVGKKDTYDIYMSGPNHNFIADGFVVHNSQQSQRYVANGGEFDIENYVIPPSINKNDEAKQIFIDTLEYIQQSYNELKGLGIKSEDARYLMPNASVTRIVDTKNCVSLLHFFSLRCCTLAQWEIRDLANQMLAICKDVLPEVFENSGPRCVSLGYCPESKKRSCGKAPTKQEIMDVYNNWKAGKCN